MKRGKKKLHLDRVTIRQLTDFEQRAALGGFLPTSKVTCETLTCETCP